MFKVRPSDLTLAPTLPGMTVTTGVLFGDTTVTLTREDLNLPAITGTVTNLQRERPLFSVTLNLHGPQDNAHGYPLGSSEADSHRDLSYQDCRDRGVPVSSPYELLITYRGEPRVSSVLKVWNDTGHAKERYAHESGQKIPQKCEQPINLPVVYDLTFWNLWASVHLAALTAGVTDGGNLTDAQQRLIIDSIAEDNRATPRREHARRAAQAMRDLINAGGTPRHLDEFAELYARQK